MKKLKGVLLIDDSKATNFFNKTILQKSELVENIMAVENGLEGINAIKEGFIPDIIFLDINMPVMNGWEFLEIFQSLKEEFKKSKIVLMLGASISKDLETKALSYSQVIGFREKMLTKTIVTKLVEEIVVCKKSDQVP